MKKLIFGGNFKEGLNIVAFSVKFKNQTPNFLIRSFANNELLDPVTGLFAIIDNSQLRLINLDQDSRYGELTEVAPEDQVNYPFIPYIFDSNELIFLYMQNVVISTDPLLPSTNPARIEIELYGDFEKEQLFSFYNNKIKKYNTKYFIKRAKNIKFVLTDSPPAPIVISDKPNITNSIRSMVDGEIKPTQGNYSPFQTVCFFLPLFSSMKKQIPYNLYSLYTMM